MKDRLVKKVSVTRSTKATDLDSRHRDRNGEIHRKRDDTILGLTAFEKISAVEGVRLSEEMRTDLRSLDTKRMDAKTRSRFITEKYGKE